MYTTCQRCLSEFHITATHLSAAGGKVRCGICNHVFNAIDHIHDHSLSVKQDKKPKDSTKIQQQKIAAESFYRAVDAPSPAVKRKSVFATVLWSAGVFLLLLAILIQFSWFNRNYILQHYPWLTPHIKWFCTQQIFCMPLRQGNIHLIKLINRDIRTHPSFANTLLANVTMVNTAPYIQPYPVVQLTLFDVKGKIIGSRKFPPEYYLDESIVIENGVPVDEKIHFVLELAEETGGVVSFEFRFTWQQ